MKHPIFYAKNETDFFNLGLGVMTNTIEATTTEERNGSFYFESKIIIDSSIYPQLENDMLIRADAGNELKDQRFRIKRIVDNHDGTASIYAEHISYLSYELSLKPEVTVSGNGSTALTIWKSSTTDANPFVVDSDISTDNITKWRIDKVKNARQGLGGIEGSILDVWGGEYRFDNYHISLLAKRGTAADVLLAYGRNITGFEQERNISNTYNSVYPYALYTDDKQQERLITLDAYCVDAENIGSFPNRKAQPVDFSSEFEHGVVPTQENLISLAQKYIKANDIGIPAVSIKVSFVDLSKTTDYSQLAPLEQLNLCDEVRVIYPKLKVNTTAKVVRVVWNVLSESYDEIEIGEKKASLSDKISEQSKSIRKIESSANAALASADGKNTNFYGLYGEGGNGEPKATKIGDSWFKTNGGKTELYQWDGTSWKFIISTDWQEIFEERLTEELTKSKEDLDEALAEKDAELKDLDTKIASEMTVIDQSVAQGKLDTATAQRRADEAVAKADQNIKEIGELDVKLIDTKTLTDKALADVNKIASENKVLTDKAQVDATKAIGDAKTAYDKAAENSGKIVIVTQDIDEIRGSITTKVEKTDFDKSLGRITQAESSIAQNANTITQKVSSTDVENILTGKAYATKSELTQTSNSLTSTISGVRTDVEGLGTNTAYAYSADGTNGFTTVYPNLNLIEDGKFAKPISSKWNTDGTTISKDSITGYFKIQFNGSGSLNRTYYTAGISTIPIGKTYSVYIKAYSLESSLNIKIGSVNTSQAVTVTNNSNIPKTYKFEGLVRGTSDTFGIFGGLITTLGTLFISEIKVEQGSTATPWMPSSSEVKPSDYPSYIGRSLKYSNIPSDYKWEINSGYTDAKTDVQQTQISQMSQDLSGFKTTVSSTYLTTANASNTYPTKDAVADTYPTKTTVTSQINQKATDITSSVQSWTNDKLTGYSTIQQTNDSITSTIAGVQVEIDKKANQTQVTQMAQDLSGFKTTVSSTYLNKTDASNLYPTKTTVATQISQSATDITSTVQSWTNDKLTGYSTIQQTNDSITSAVANKADRSQITQLSDSITSTVTGLTNESLITTQMMKDTTLVNPIFNTMIMVEVPVTNGETYTVSTNLPWDIDAAHVFFIRATSTRPDSAINGVYDGKSITSQALSDKIYIVFRNQNFLNRFINGQYWVKVEKTPASQSQITQLATDINLRVTKDSVVNQINISNEGILIAGSKVQITGQTYIENGVITSAKIQDLSASKLTAGTINGSVINVININAGNITTGTLSADRIAANSITATHISISSLSALSANLGTVTAGTINAATVNIININANSITTGTLSADRIDANSITADKINATSLQLFSNDSYLKVASDGLRFQSKAQLRFGSWLQVTDGKPTSTSGLYLGGWGNSSSVKHVAFTRADGSTFMMRAEPGMDFGSNQNVYTDNLNIYDSVQFWESARVHGNLINEGYIAMGGGIQESSIQYDKPAGTMNFRVPGGRSGSYFWFNQKVIAVGSFDSASRLSLKDVRGKYQGSALDDICKTDIVEYSYKNSPNDRQLSPIIDDINEVKKYHLPDIINDGKTVNLYAMNSLSWLAIKQLAQKLENIEEKLDAIA